MENLIKKLNNAANVYYNEGREIMSNFEFDNLYDKLVQMEKETGIVLPDSPTQRAGYQVVDSLPKERHEFPALSLDKTKDVSLFPKVFGVRDNKSVIMWKLDGSTIQLTYDNGKLTKALTRGNGEVGSVITHNTPYIKGLPMEISYKGHLVVRGEPVMSYKEFERINAELPDEAELYKNPRNLATSTISLLDSRIMASREIWFKAFNLVYMENMPQSFYHRLTLLHGWNFNVVEFILAEGSEELLKGIADMTAEAENYAFPVDGLVVAANDAAYAEKQPGTGHNPNKLVGYALKWEDETVKTTLREIEWSASRTGLLNPVAIFDPVELEGTTVTRATLHNVSVVEQLHLHVGDTLSIYKANKIIPAVAANLSDNNGTVELPHLCPVCGYSADIATNRHQDKITKTLWCKNPNCAAKHIGRYVHFCERDCLNIEGISEATIEKFVSRGFIREFADIYHLDRYRDEIVQMEGFGQKSYDKIITAVEKSRNTNFVSLLHAFGIPNVGKGQSKLIKKYIDQNGLRTPWEDFCNKLEMGFDFTFIDGIGEVINASLYEWYEKSCKSNSDETPELWKLIPELTINDDSVQVESILSGKTFVITGNVEHFTNRDEIKDFIESKGGKTSGSVSKNTSYLINNDTTSTSGKNKKAQELGVPVISEEDLLAMCN